MRRIDRDKIENLIIDLSICSGGMIENVYKTLDYFTDCPVNRTEIYRVTDDNREIVQALMSNDLLTPKGRPSPTVGFSRRYEVRNALSYGYSFLYAVPAPTSKT